MQLPAQLYRRKANVHKNDFGHALIIAGSKSMAGACALTALAAIRAGCGLVTVGIPESLNGIIQKKINNTIMTLPLKETSQQTISAGAWNQLSPIIKRFTVVALGPGLSTNPSTQKFIRTAIAQSSIATVVDADGLNAIAGNLDDLELNTTPKILTPHPGEMGRLIKKSKVYIENNKNNVIADFVNQHKNCTLVLKGHNSSVSQFNKRTYINKTGNAGMAKAGSGDVLTGIISALLCQGLTAFDAAKYGCYIHGLAGDLAAKRRSKTTMVAQDIIDSLDIIFK